MPITITQHRPREVAAFLEACRTVPPAAVSACAGWTTHEVTAHLAAAAAELSRHLTPWLAGEPVPATRSFEEREPAFRALPDRELPGRLADEEERARGLCEQVLTRDPDAVIPWTGRTMAVAAFLPHLRNEFALHRWDIVGDDEVGDELLAQPELTRHAVTELGPILVRRGAAHDPDPGVDFAVRLRAGTTDDVRLFARGGTYGLEMVTDDADEPSIESDAAARTLVLWGRRPDRRGRIRSRLPQRDLARMQALLAGY